MQLRQAEGGVRGNLPTLPHNAPSAPLMRSSCAQWPAPPELVAHPAHIALEIRFTVMQ